MIPAAFAYARPTTLDEALEAVASGGEDVKILAGGQSLIPVMRLRLAAPETVVDLTRVSELRGVRDDDLRRTRLRRIRLTLLGDRGDLHPVVERRLLDRLVADARDRVAGDTAPAGADQQRGEHKKGAQRQRAVLRKHAVILVG